MKVRQHSELPGLAAFAAVAEDARWSIANWERWPFILIGGDCAGDNCASDNALINEYHLNMIRFPDTSHGSWRSVQCAMNDIGMKGFWTLAVVTVNVNCGPDKSDSWYHEIRDACTYLYSTCTPGTTPLFQMHHGDIVKCLKNLGMELESWSEAAVWAYLKKRNETRPKYSHCNQNRFFGSIRRVRQELGIWAIDKFERTWTALESDHIPSKHIAKPFKIVKGDDRSDAEGDAVGTTSEAKRTDEARVLAQGLRNAPGIACMMLNGDGYDLYCTVLVKFAEPCEAWHSKANVDMRTADGSCEWVIKQINADYAAHCNAIVEQLTSPLVLDTCKLFDGPPATEEADALDEEIAVLSFDYAMSLYTHRWVRGISLVEGWPLRMSLAVKGEESGGIVVKEFDQDMIFEALLTITFDTVFII